ncbi:MAG: pyridoxal 5'-phosphate synthase glutaminase subunit PdxT, partial [Thermoanaerobaculum sp.]|nr:pyridoxal 5'-phosphate synthase glutaminase subunit PdxT [Thermoanaerobaculum sp.]
PSLEGVFIRAPRVVRVGEGVKVLATRGEDPVLVRQGAILAATFHPELSPASPVVALFADMVRRKS